MNTISEHRLYTQAEDDAAVVAYLNNGDRFALLPQLRGTGAPRISLRELNEYAAAAIDAARILQILDLDGNGYSWRLAPVKGDTVQALVIGKNRGQRVEHVITRTLDRAPWLSRNGKSLVISDGHDLNAVELSSVMVISPAADTRSADANLPSSPTCPIHGADCEAWA